MPVGPIYRASGLAQGVSTRSRTRPSLYQRVHALLIFSCSRGYQRDNRIQLQKHEMENIASRIICLLAVDIY